MQERAEREPKSQCLPAYVESLVDSMGGTATTLHNSRGAGEPELVTQL